MVLSHKLLFSLICTTYVCRVSREASLWLFKLLPGWLGWWVLHLHLCHLGWGTAAVAREYDSLGRELSASLHHCYLLLYGCPGRPQIHLCCCYQASQQLKEKARSCSYHGVGPHSNSSTLDGFSGAAGSAMVSGEPRLWAPSLFFTPRCIPFVFQDAHLHLYWRSDLPGILGCWAEEPLLGYCWWTGK